MNNSAKFKTNSKPHSLYCRYIDGGVGRHPLCPWESQNLKVEIKRVEKVCSPKK